MKLRRLLGVTTALFTLVLLWQCYPDKRAYSLNAAHELTEFKRMSRMDQVKKCGSCHRQEYENEMKGPHAHAYLSLVQHQKFINSAAYDCPGYALHVNQSISVCLSCHASANLFETVYTARAGYLHLSDSLLKVPGLIVTPRTDSATYLTGIDCLTCHFDGKEVVTNSNFVASPMSSCPSYCSPVASPMFSANINCYACHQAAVKSMHAQLGTFAVKNVGCTSCHQEHDNNGKPTHYMYWRGDPKSGKKSIPAQAMLEDIKATVNGAELRVNWVNQYFPHQIAECPEWLINFKVINEGNEVIGTGMIRLNRKEYYDSQMYAAMGDKNLPGRKGTELSFDGKPGTCIIKLSKASKHPSLVISAVSKAQYWFPDSLGVLMSEKVLKL